MASHEMRTPLSIIRHQLEVALSMPYQDPSLQKAIASAYDEVLRLNGTVEDLLNLSTLQTGTANLSFTYFGLHDFLKVFYDEALFLTRQKGISIVFAKVQPMTIEADAGRLRQVLFNLLDNSIKNTPAEGRIRITAEAQENDVLITFSDTGRGISPQSLSRIFEPFYSETSNDADGRGTGLGLSLVKWIVESHSGKISVESKLNEGTTFLIRIPKFQSTPI
jgi:two-component system phosphate regulon sensor histidine kinase PhoR